MGINADHTIFSVKSPKVVALQKCKVVDRGLTYSYSVLLPFVAKNTVLNRRIYCLNGKVFENSNLRSIAIYPGEYKHY
jgi:hypothetical protein